MGRNTGPDESTKVQRREKIDELMDVVNPPNGGVISGMTKRLGFSNGRQVEVDNMPKDSRRKGRL